MSRILGVAVSLLLVFTASASAQSPTGDAYGGSSKVLSDVATSDAGADPSTASGANLPGVGASAASGDDAAGFVAAVPGASPRALDSLLDGDDAPSRRVAVASTSTSTTGGSLPFTGLDLGLLALGSIVLIALGLGLRRYGRTVPSA